MAVIQRPVKTYGTRNYVAEVAAAPGNLDTILANEVDGDLDTIYGAWNGGTDTVNVKDGAVTLVKLAAEVKAAGGDLSGSYPNPTVVKSTGDFNVGGAFNAAGAFTVVGDGTFGGRLRAKHHQGGVTGVNQVVAQGVTAELALPNISYDTGGMASNSRVWSPGFQSIIGINVFASVNVVNGLGWALRIEQWTGSAFFLIANESTTTQLNLNASVIWPSAASLQYRALVINATTGAFTVTQAFLFSGSFGAY